MLFALQVRLQYAGKELDPSKDGEAIDLKEPTNSKGKLFVMHAMQRMQGGQWPSSHHSNKLRFKLNISSGTSVDANCSSSLKSMTAPGAGRGPAAAQLAKQFKDLLKHPIPGVSAAPDENDPMIWHVRVSSKQRVVSRASSARSELVCGSGMVVHGPLSGLHSSSNCQSDTR